MLKKKLMWIVWPACLAACVLELLIFALVDPQDLHWAGQALPLSIQGLYSAAFFVFWAIGMVSGGLTVLLGAASAEVNAYPLADGTGGKNVRS